MKSDDEGKLDGLERIIWQLIEFHKAALEETREKDDVKRIRSHAGSLAILTGIALKIVYARIKLGQPPKDELLERLAMIPEKEPRMAHFVETEKGVKILSKRLAYAFR